MPIFPRRTGESLFKIVRTETHSPTDTLNIRSKLKEMLGPMKDTISVEIVFVDDIQKTASGKTLIVNQKLDMRKYSWLSS